MKNYFKPKTVNYEQGQKRLISLDFLKGICIYLMLWVHEFSSNVDRDYQFEGGMFQIIIFYIVGGIISILSCFRPCFIMLSGFIGWYIFYKKSLKLTYKQVLIQQLITLLGSLTLLPLFYIMNYINLQVVAASENGSNIVNYPFYTYTSMMSTAVSYFGLQDCFVPFINVFIYTLFVRPFKYIRITLYKKSQIVAIAGFFLFYLFIWLFTPFGLLFRLISAAIDHRDIQDLPCDCPGDYYSFNKAITLGESIKYMFLTTLSGEYMQIHSQLVFYFYGIGLAALFHIFEAKKQEIAILEIPTQEKAKIYQKTRKIHLTTMWLMLIPDIINLIANYIFNQWLYNNKNNLRPSFFSYDKLFSQFIPNGCYKPEYNSYAIILFHLSWCISVQIFEAGTKKQTEIRTERILYLRRYSTYSLTYFVFGYVSGTLVRQVFNYQNKSINSLQLLVVILFGFTIDYLIQCEILDRIKGIFTPDWILSKISQQFNLNKENNDDSIANEHLCIYPANVFQKDLY